MSEQLVCRLCGVRKNAEDVIGDLNEVQQDDTVTNSIFRDYVNYFCRINLSLDPKLPTKVCRVCRLMIEHFTAFVDQVLKLEKIFTSAAGSSGMVRKK
jgi:hypothetical protein